MNELEAKLEQAHRDRTMQIGTLEQMDCEIESLKEQIAEEKKPKLRHGDYGLWDREASLSSDNLTFIALEVGDKLHWLSKDNSNSTYKKDCGPVDYKNLDDFVKLGNIFDDLKALQEDVTEFVSHSTKTDRCIRFKLNREGALHVAIEKEGGVQAGLHLDISHITPLLRQMEMTMKRNK